MLVQPSSSFFVQTPRISLFWENSQPSPFQLKPYWSSVFFPRISKKPSIRHLSETH